MRKNMIEPEVSGSEIREQVLLPKAEAESRLSAAKAEIERLKRELEAAEARKGSLQATLSAHREAEKNRRESLRALLSEKVDAVTLASIEELLPTRRVVTRRKYDPIYKEVSPETSK